MVRSQRLLAIGIVLVCSALFRCGGEDDSPSEGTTGVECTPGEQTCGETELSGKPAVLECIIVEGGTPHKDWSVVEQCVAGDSCIDEPNPHCDTTCTSTKDCDGALFCIGGICKDPKCKSTADCGYGRVCLESGTCRSVDEIECGVPELQKMCAPSETCQNYQCVGEGCSPEGTTKTCYVGCHAGKKLCQNGDWTECDALPLADEQCGDQVDNDCDGQTDEECP